MSIMAKIEDITWPRGETNFIFEWEILSARENEICIPKRPCNDLFILEILMKFLHKRQHFFLFVFNEFFNITFQDFGKSSWMFSKLGKSMDVKIWQLIEKVTGNFTVSAPLSHFVNEISKEQAARLSGKLSCNWLIMLVTMATPISSHVKGFKQYLRAMKIWFLVKDKILVFHQYLWNKDVFVMNLLSSKSI